jgi:hypothetical protein
MLHRDQIAYHRQIGPQEKQEEDPPGGCRRSVKEDAEREYERTFDTQ